MHQHRQRRGVYEEDDIQMTKQIQEHSKRSRNIIVNKMSSIVLFFGVTIVVLFTLLFTTYPAIHDFLHGLRHSMMIIPCH